MSERDPDLEEMLGSKDTEQDLDLDALFAGVQGRVRDAEASPAYRMKSQATQLRRLLGVGALLFVLIVSLMTGQREDLGRYPPELLALFFGSLGTLCVLAVFVALRPIHRPPLSPVQTWGLAGLTVLAACALAIVPNLHAHVLARAAAPSLLAHATPCMLYGFLFGLPVFAALRFLARGSDTVARVLAASAAGLAGNMVLELHCPIGGAAHLLAGHAMVVVAYVVGMTLIEVLMPQRA